MSLKRKGDDGAPKSKYTPSAKGPDHCQACEHFQRIDSKTHGGCNHPEIVAEADKGLLYMIGKFAMINKNGWCKYFERKAS